jgi:hypothetical protein
MEDRGWRMEDGGWRMEDGGWRMEDGGWRMEDGEQGEEANRWERKGITEKGEAKDIRDDAEKDGKVRIYKLIGLDE